MKVTVEALGSKSANRLLAAGATQIMIPCIHELDAAITQASRVIGPVMVHVPANRVRDLRETSANLTRKKITSVLAVSGNPGHGRSRYSVYDVIEYFSNAGFQVAVGGYPESYLTTTSARHRNNSTRIIARKQAVGAHHVITQASFNAKNMSQWLLQLRSQGVELPVHVSVTPTVPWHVIAKMGLRTATENRAHLLRQINRPNIDLLFRTLRSHLQDTMKFVRAVRQARVLSSDDSFHIFSYGVRVDDLVREITDMTLWQSRSGWRDAAGKVDANR